MHVLSTSLAYYTTTEAPFSHCGIYVAEIPDLGEFSPPLWSHRVLAGQSHPVYPDALCFEYRLAVMLCVHYGLFCLSLLWLFQPSSALQISHIVLPNPTA